MMRKKKIPSPITKGAVKVPVVMQLEALECGAASLAMVMAYYGKWVPLEQVRADCGVSRDGSKASNVYKAAVAYGFDAKAFRLTPEGLRTKGRFPCILHWGFNHFVVLNGFKGKYAYINDPARGFVKVDAEEFDQLNPLYTDVEGCYAWDVPEGFWQVRYEKDGYEAASSDWLPVPPPQLGVNVGIAAKTAPEVKKEESKEEAKTETKTETKTEEAKTEETKTEEAKTEEAKTEEAKTEETKTEETKTETKTEEAKTEEAETSDTSPKKNPVHHLLSIIGKYSKKV